MKTEPYSPFWANINTTDIQRHAISLRSFLVIVSWTIISALASFVFGWNVLWLIIFMPLFTVIYYAQMWASVSTARVVGVYKTDLELSSDGMFKARWGIRSHLWGRNQWRAGISKSQPVIIIRWPWCLFVSYSVFPVLEEETNQTEQVAASDR